jgi:hypothetical protein
MWRMDRIMDMYYFVIVHFKYGDEQMWLSVSRHDDPNSAGIKLNECRKTYNTLRGAEFSPTIVRGVELPVDLYYEEDA